MNFFKSSVQSLIKFDDHERIMNHLMALITH